MKTVVKSGVFDPREYKKVKNDYIIHNFNSLIIKRFALYARSAAARNVKI